MVVQRDGVKKVNLYKDPTTARGTEESTVGNDVPTIGRAKSRGFEYVTGSETDDIFATTNTYRHYLFDVEMFTHVDCIGSASYTTGEIKINSINITSVENVDGAASSVIRLTVVPDSQDIIAVRNQILEIDFVNTTINGAVDATAVGDSSAGTSEVTTSRSPTISSY